MPRYDATTELLDVVATARVTVSMADGEPSDTVREQLNNLACALVDSDGACDERIHTYVSEMESLSRQVAYHGDPDLDGHTIESILSSVHENATGYRTEDITSNELTEHTDNVRSDILDARPDTNVIEEYGLQEAFDETVRQMMTDLREE